MICPIQSVLNFSNRIAMSTLSVRDRMTQELIRLNIANKLMDEEMKRLQPELVKYEKAVHPAARPVQAETVSTISLAEKTKGIKQDTAKLKFVENDLTTFNANVSTLFDDVATKVSLRDSLFSEIEQATCKMNSLTVGCSQFKANSCDVQTSVLNESNQLSAVTTGFQERLKEKVSKLATLQKGQSDLDKTINIRQDRIKTLQTKKAEYASKIDINSLNHLKAQLKDMTEQTAKLNDYIAVITKDEGQRLESLTLSITECEALKKKKSQLSEQLEKLNGRGDITALEMEEHKKQMEVAQEKLNDLTVKKDYLSKNHEVTMAQVKERSDSLIESLRIKKDTAEKELELVKMRMENREECLKLRKELESYGKIEPLNLSEEFESLNREIEETRASITKTISEGEYYRAVSVRCNAEVDELHARDKRRRNQVLRRLHEKDAVANHYEIEVLKLRKKLAQEKIERDDRIAQETRRLLEKAKEEKERKEKEEKRRIAKEKEKEEKKRVEKEREREREREKLRKMKEEEDKKTAKRIKEENEKRKKEESKNRMIDAVQNKNGSAAIVSRVQQRRMNMEAAASIPFGCNEGSLMRPPPIHPPPVHPPPIPPLPSLQSGMNLRRHSIPKKSMIVFDDDSSEDDDDDMSDFLLDDSTRIMPKVPEKYAGSPPRVNKQPTLNPFDLSFADVQSSTPLRSKNNPTPALEISFNQVVTSTPLISRGSKTNKKQTRPRGKKRTK